MARETSYQGQRSCESSGEAYAAEVDNREVLTPREAARRAATVRQMVSQAINNDPQQCVVDPNWGLNRRVADITDRLLKTERYLDTVRSDVDALKRAYECRLRALEDAEGNKTSLFRELDQAIREAAQESNQ